MMHGNDGASFVGKRFQNRDDRLFGCGVNAGKWFVQQVQIGTLRQRAVDELGTRTMLQVPLVQEGRCIGVIALFRKKQTVSLEAVNELRN